MKDDAFEEWFRSEYPVASELMLSDEGYKSKVVEMREIYQAGRELGKREGMERAAEIAESCRQHNMDGVKHHKDWHNAQQYHIEKHNSAAEIRDAIRKEIKEVTP